jgi:DNA-binding HxlR family transcriptional regulator/putative sterol carrier protein
LGAVCDDVGMADYGNFCPIAIATDVIADRWTPLILRELVLGNTRFNDIARGLPGISRSLLVQRLKHLERKGVIETWPLPNGRGSEYHLTPAGKDLEPVLIVMGRWSVAWMYANLDSTDVDAVTLMWWMHRRVDVTRLPHDRVIVQFDHTAPKRCSFWVVIEQGAASVCLQDPGFAVDAIVTCTTLALARVFSGIELWREAVASGAIEVTGSRAVVNSLPRWFMWSPWAHEMRAVTESLAST